MGRYAYSSSIWSAYFSKIGLRFSFIVGLTNDIGRLSGEGFQVR